MGRAKEQHTFIKLCIANYWLRPVIIVFEPTVFFDGRKICSNQTHCLARRGIGIAKRNKRSPQQVSRNHVRKDPGVLGSWVWLVTH